MARPKDPSLAAPMAPRFALGWAALLYAACALALGYPALGGGFLVNPLSDQYIAGYPFREFAAEALRTTGGFPLWNPYQFGGMPFVAAMHGDIFYPTFLLRMVMPTDAAMTWSFIIHLFLAGLFTYAFLRAAGLGFFGSLVGGAAYMLSGQVASFVSPGHDGKLYVSTLLPLALWMLVRGVRDGRAWAWGLLALTVGLAVLSPHPQLLQYMLLVCGAFALYLAFGGSGEERLERRVAIRRLAFALGAVILGGLIGAIQYLPVSEYVAWSPRAGGKGWEHAVSYSMPPEELINTYLPQFSGILEQYWGRNGIHFHSEYIGASVLLLAGAALGRTAGRRSFTWFWLGTFVVTLLWALGGFTPFYSLVYYLVPGTKYFRAPSTILYVVTFSAAVLAALGTERGLRREIGPRYLIGWLAFALLVGVLGATGSWTSLASTLADPSRYDAVFANGGAVLAGAWRSFVFVALTATVLLMLRGGRISYRIAGWALAVIVSTDLWSVLRAYWRFSPPAAQLYASDPAIDYVRRQRQPARVLARPLSSDMGFHDPMLTGAGLMHHDVRQVFGYHGNELGRYDALFEREGVIVNPNFWQLYNVRFLYTNVPEIPIQGAERVVGPVTDAAGTTVYLFQLPGTNPAAWVAPAIVKAPDDVALATLLDPRFPVASTAIFRDSSTVPARTDLKAPPAPLAIEASFTRYEPGRISITLSAPAPKGSALMVSENYYPGWTATADGRPAFVDRADYTLIGVELPEGARSVELSFRSRPYETGKAVTLASLGAVAVLILAGALLDRRRRIV